MFNSNLIRCCSFSEKVDSFFNLRSQFVLLFIAII